MLVYETGVCQSGKFESNLILSMGKLNMLFKISEVCEQDCVILDVLIALWHVSMVWQCVE